MRFERPQLGEGHLPGCWLETFAEIAAEPGKAPPDPELGAGGIEHCVEGCPVLAREMVEINKRAEELAARMATEGPQDG